MQRVLIANHGLEKLAGSEIHALQLARYFQEIGADVTLGCLVQGEPFLSSARDAGLSIADLRDPVLRRDWDLIWTHQQSCYLRVHAMAGLRARLHVHGCLSYFVRQEQPPLGAAATNVRLVANSEETRYHLGGNLDVLRNITPKVFLANPKTSHPPSPARIAIVSNHPPCEVRNAADLLRAEGVDVIIYGSEDQPLFIDETVLPGFDVVVSIGKTVQYALAQAVPVFVYDHFGGPGYMSRETWQDHEAKNYSGRSANNKQEAPALVRMLMDGYREALSDLAWFRENVAPRYDLERQLGRLKLSLASEPQPLLSPAQRLAHLVLVALCRPLIMGYALTPAVARRLSGAKPNIRRAKRQ